MSKVIAKADRLLTDRKFVGYTARVHGDRCAHAQEHRRRGLVSQGQISDGLYIVLSGKNSVVVAAGGTDRQIATLGCGDVFGEMSLLAQEPAVATVTASRKSFVLKLPAAAFRQIIMTHPQVLVFVGELAEKRREALRAISDGSRDYEVEHLDIL